MGGPDYFDDECIYDSCSDGTCRELLLDFLESRTSGSPPVALELSKLLSKRGFVVRDRMEPLFLDPDAYFSHSKSLFLSYLVVMENGETRAIQLLDHVPGDSRDGLFLACYRLGTESIFKKLIEKVREWQAEDRYWGHDGTGEAFRVLKILTKCMPLFPHVCCEDVVAICKSRPSE